MCVTNRYNRKRFFDSRCIKCVWPAGGAHIALPDTVAGFMGTASRQEIGWEGTKEGDMRGSRDLPPIPGSATVWNQGQNSQVALGAYLSN